MSYAYICAKVELTEHKTFRGSVNNDAISFGRANYISQLPISSA